VGTFKEHGASLVAITPQLAEAGRSLIEKHGISFDLLSDPGNDYAAKLGLRFKLPDDLKAVYLSFGIDLAAHNREGSWTLPMPGRFVIDRGGIVHAVDVEPDYQYRPSRRRQSTTSRLLREAAREFELSHLGEGLTPQPRSSAVPWALGDGQPLRDPQRGWPFCGMACSRRSAAPEFRNVLPVAAHDEVCEKPGPAGLVCRPEPLAGVGMKILVEKQ